MLRQMVEMLVNVFVFTQGEENQRVSLENKSASAQSKKILSELNEVKTDLKPFYVDPHKVSKRRVKFGEDSIKRIKSIDLSVSFSEATTDIYRKMKSQSISSLTLENIDDVAQVYYSKIGQLIYNTPEFKNNLQNATNDISKPFHWAPLCIFYLISEFNKSTAALQKKHITLTLADLARLRWEMEDKIWIVKLYENCRKLVLSMMDFDEKVRTLKSNIILRKADYASIAELKKNRLTHSEKKMLLNIKKITNSLFYHNLKIKIECQSQVEELCDSIEDIFHSKLTEGTFQYLRTKRNIQSITEENIADILKLEKKGVLKEGSINSTRLVRNQPTELSDLVRKKTGLGRQTQNEISTFDIYDSHLLGNFKYHRLFTFEESREKYEEAEKNMVVVSTVNVKNLKPAIKK